MPDKSVEEELGALARVWWLPLGMGILSIVAGVIVLIKPGNSLKAIAIVVGIFVALDGVIALIGASRRSTEGRGLMALMGVLGLVVGVLLIRHPMSSVTAIAVLCGIWLIALGGIRFVLSFEEQEHRGWRMIIAMIEVIAGIVIVSTPGIGITTLAILIGIALILNGASLAVLGSMLHGLLREEGQPPHHTHAAPA